METSARLTSAASRRLAIVAGFMAFVWAGTPGAARADVVTDWNLITTQVAAGPALLRSLTMVHLAMFDAANAVTSRYTSYLAGVSYQPGSSAPAAAASAAHGVLVRLFPAQQIVLAAALNTSIADIADGPARSAGLALGDQVAAMLVAARLNDKILAPGPAYVPLGFLGAYQLTPPAFGQPVNTGAANWVPFALFSPSQFRFNGPLPLTHPKYEMDVEEVRTIGSAVSSVRTAEQSLIARWHVETAIPALNRIARAEASLRELDLTDRARLFALLNMTISDAGASAFEAKYFYQSWRPVTAIRLAEPTWTPFINTPPHPEYPAAHAVIGMAAAQALEAVFGQNYNFPTTSNSVPGATRTFESFNAWAVDGSMSRIYGGIHFRTAVEEGMKQGKQVGSWIAANYLLPLPRHHED